MRLFRQKHPGAFYKKPFLLFSLAALSSVTLLTGCHGAKDQSAFTIPGEFDTSRDYEITFWAKNDTNKTQTEIYKKAISDFEALYPNITVDLRLYTDYGKIYNDVITNIATGTTPNVCITYPDHIATYLTGNDTVVPLDDLMADSSYGFGGDKLEFASVKKDEIIPRFLQECSFSGHYYALPFMRSTEACYVNKTYVEKLGYTLPETLTWDFVWEVSEAAMAQNADGTYKVNDQNVLIPFIDKSTDNMMIEMLKQKNAGYSTDSGEIQLFNDTTASLLDTIAEHVKTGAFSTFKISSYPANFLNAVQTAYSETEGYVPVTSKAQESDQYQDYLSREGEDNSTYYDVKIKASRLLLDNVEHTFVTPVFNGSASLRDAAGQLIESVTKSVRRKQEIDDAYIDKLYSDVTSLYHLDQISSDQSSGKKELGPLPAESRILLGSLAVVWGLILLYLLLERLKKKKGYCSLRSQ